MVVALQLELVSLVAGQFVYKVALAAVALDAAAVAAPVAACDIEQANLESMMSDYY